jgi:hypothetical protein
MVALTPRFRGQTELPEMSAPSAPTDMQTAREDLAFLRQLVDTSDAGLPGFGETYLAAGVTYGLQMLLHAGQALGWISNAPGLALLIGFGPTLAFIPILIWILWRHRTQKPPAAVTRAVGAVFGAVGLANLVLVGVIGSVAWREHSVTTWLIYPCAVFVLQGAAWLVAALLRRRGWMAAVAAGWGAAAIAMAFNVQAFGYYILFAGLGIWGCMALPGWLMTRMALTDAAPAAAVAAR